MSERRIESFEEFWPYYVKQHSKKGTRILHFVGTTGAFACVAGGLLTKKRWLLGVAPVVGYGFSWVGHFFVEKNRPATFSYPLWSLRGDMVMWWKTLIFSMDAEVERVLAEERAAEAKAAEPVEPGEPAAPVEATSEVGARGEAVN